MLEMLKVMPKDLSRKNVALYNFCCVPKHQVTAKQFLGTGKFTAPRNKRYTAYRVFCSVKILPTRSKHAVIG